MLEPNPAIPEAQGFPGVSSQVADAETLVSPSTILFVADDDADLATFDTFPSGVTLRFRASTALVAANGEALQEQVLAVTTVGQDLQTPEIALTPPPSEMPMITPGNGDVDVQPDTTIRMEFTEPIQPFSLGEIEGQGPALLSSAVSIVFGPDSSGDSFSTVDVDELSGSFRATQLGVRGALLISADFFTGLLDGVQSIPAPGAAVLCDYFRQ